MARTNLKLFRVQQKKTQDEMAQQIGCTRATYSMIESGKRNGREAFWLDLQKAFSVDDSNMWALRKND